MSKKQLFDSQQLSITIERLCRQLIENHDSFEESVLIGIQPRGSFLAKRLHQRLQDITGKNILLGFLDITFFRDDFRRRSQPIQANRTQIDFVIEDKKVVLIDDVLYTGRTVRAALDAMIAFGRPQKVELLVLIDRKYSRDLPIQADYVGRRVSSLPTDRIVVQLCEQGFAADSIQLVSHDETK
ncbi:pyrimidine operon attenuation protein/uracil phosphoribosyltransferase [Thermonema lapsum]|jgi:pyrimidine operon attenuation protein/uracil phosphoribosyltransferase|uniref:Pyrimidine operon attenuation protein/uracil phosphoribosyltransferase n=1 Tax=Thermonema lapsum TaxID=28195 RepID=A0A846MPF5_9BACT|nr:bifunctional pyr operon transcriptional regulator/uracil phosphoribosyltransferase PyrR [Thermonema lapsum]NIK73446.1 pyrimidine operon attenuation protein/uracil phosphoribosyltransferase [Thermonema lapsum]